MNEIIKENLGVAGMVRVTKYLAGTKKILWQSGWMKNIVVNSANRGRNLIVQRLVNMTTYSLAITHGEIGTSAGAVANSDTGLGTPVARVTTALASVGVSLNQAQLQFFFTDDQLANGTYYEFGTFVDGSSGTATGQLFNHILFPTPYTKATGEDTTIEVDFTID